MYVHLFRLLAFLEKKSPKAIAKNPIKSINNELKKNNLYWPWLIKLNNLKDHPLNVVKDPQNPKPKINLYLLEIDNAFMIPNKKQPITFTIKISSICHRINAPGTAPIEIRKNLLFWKKLVIY